MLKQIVKGQLERPYAWRGSTVDEGMKKKIPSVSIQQIKAR